MESNRVAAGIFLGGICVGLMAACNGGGGHGNTLHGFSNRVLVSDGAVASDHVDASLVNPWGIAFLPGGPAYVANNGTQTSTLYDGGGVALPVVIAIPDGTNGDADPTGEVYNGSGDFIVHSGATSVAAQFLFDGEGGTITGWAMTLGTNAVVAYDDGSGGAVYKGLAIASDAGANFLYATDFHNNKVDVFDTNFVKVVAPGNFIDPTMPADYAPFGIQAVGSNLIVTFAQQESGSDDEEHGAGLGFVDQFDAAGNFVKRLVSNGALNAPWGIAMAPADFGALSNMLLIGNFGDGTINAYDPTSGAFVGTVSTPQGVPIAVPGLWGIGFGNGADNQPLNTLFYTAGINDEADGAYGRIDTTSVSDNSM